MEQTSFWPMLSQEQRIRRKVIKDIQRVCLMTLGSFAVVTGLLRYAVAIF